MEAFSAELGKVGNVGFCHGRKRDFEMRAYRQLIVRTFVNRECHIV